MARFAVVGLGRVGLSSLVLLRLLGFEAFGISNSLDSVERARGLGFEAYPGDIIATPRVVEKHGGADVVLLAVPGSVGYEALRRLVGAGYDVVDVSFFPEDPRGLRRLVEDRGVTVVVDAGVAPGLSNALVARARLLHGARRARIYVGGVSQDPRVPLGLAATWSMEDLLEEYLRPARMIVAGRLSRVRPLEAEPGRIRVPGVGVMEYFPTDGLRTLLQSYGGVMEELVEYTLRWPGHHEAMRLLHAIGLLGDRPFNSGGCPVVPRECLARLLEHVLPEGPDLVVLLAAGESPGGAVLYRLVSTPWSGFTAMSRSTSSFHVAAAVAVAEGLLGPGLVYPERLGEADPAWETVEWVLRRVGLRVDEEECPRMGECLEEA